jgi:hypothetical protein
VRPEFREFVAPFFSFCSGEFGIRAEVSGKLVRFFVSQKTSWVFRQPENELFMCGNQSDSRVGRRAQRKRRRRVSFASEGKRAGFPGNPMGYS